VDLTTLVHIVVQLPMVQIAHVDVHLIIIIVVVHLIITMNVVYMEIHIPTHVVLLIMKFIAAKAITIILTPVVKVIIAILAVIHIYFLVIHVVRDMDIMDAMVMVV